MSATSAPAIITLAIRVSRIPKSVKMRDLVASEVTPIATPTKSAAKRGSPQRSITATPKTKGTTKPPSAV